MKFKEFKKYVSKIDRVSICIKETLHYENFMFISEVPDKYDELYLYGIGRIQSEFPASQAPDVVVRMNNKPGDDMMVYAECIEIMLSEKPREDV